MILVCDDKQLEFQQCELQFSAVALKNIFQHYSKPVSAVLLSRRYTRFAETVHLEYKNFEQLPLGKFLYQLKQQNDLFYLKFLNKYGDGEYCSFSIQTEELAKLKGLYAFCVHGKLMYLGRCRDSFSKRINWGYGKIHPKNCFLDGQATNCHLNALINSCSNDVRFYILPLECASDIISLEKALILECKPEWNIALAKVK